MNDALLMHVLYSRYDLSEFRPGFSFFHSSVGDEIVENFASVRVFHHQMEGAVRLDHLEQLHYNTVSANRKNELANQGSFFRIVRIVWFGQSGCKFYYITHSRIVISHFKQCEPKITNPETYDSPTLGWCSIFMMRTSRNNLFRLVAFIVFLSMTLIATSRPVKTWRASFTEPRFATLSLAKFSEIFT